MEQIWKITVDWMAAWDSWKTGLFQNLNVEEMETAAGNFNKKVRRPWLGVTWLSAFSALCGYLDVSAAMMLALLLLLMMTCLGACMAWL
jgi:hypothetical protein